VECLTGSRGTADASNDLMEVTYVLSGAMLMLGKKAGTIAEGVALSRASIDDGTAFNKLLEIVTAQSGDASALENLERYPLSKHAIEVKTMERGYVGGIDSLELGISNVTLGAGRAKIEDVIDPKAGIVLAKKVGDVVDDGDVLATFYTDKDGTIEPARERIRKAFRVQSAPPKQKPLILSYVEKGGVKTWM
jgi:pyrimidine-nucleoside phosphorylase